MNKFSFILISLSLLSSMAFAGGPEDNLLELRTKIKLHEVPTDIDETVEFILFSDHTYKLTKEEFCGFLNLGTIRERIESAVANFKPRKQAWFANLRPKLELCAGSKSDHYNRWIRRINFIFLLDGEKAREGFKNAIKADPARMTEYQMQHARILLAEGKTEQFVAETNAIINQKPKATEDYKKNLLWAHVFLGSYKLTQGEFDAAREHFAKVDEETRKADDKIGAELRVVEFHADLAEYFAGHKKEKPKLAKFCEDKSDYFMRYREVEICLVAEHLLNKKSVSKYAAELESYSTKLLPVQVPQVALTMMTLSDRGLVITIDPKKWLLDNDLDNLNQTIFKFIFDLAKRPADSPKLTLETDPVIKAMGRYSLYGLLKYPLGPVPAK